MRLGLKFIGLLILLLSLFPTVHAQTLQQGRDLFTAGEYDKALPIMKKYLSQQPENASRNYWYGVCLYETGSKDKCQPYLAKAAKKKIVKAYRYLGMYYADCMKYPEAIEAYESFIAGLKADRELHDPELEEICQAKTDSLKRVFRMFRNTEKVCFIDSFKVSKDNIFKTYKLDQSAGSIDSYSGFFGLEGEGDVFAPEKGSGIYFSRLDNDGIFRLYQAYKSFDEWTDITPIGTVNNGSDTRYPFVLSDGATLYYASKGPESIGGYDIFVTRYNPNTGQFLIPENIGMPFNSGANDYLYAIDELNNLGWFATDRNQPEDSVCIYVFIPNETRLKYNYEEGDTALIRRAAKIASISETQTDPDAVRSARQRLMMMTYGNNSNQDNRSQVFVIDDLTDYHSAEDFRSPQARRAYTEWVRRKETLEQNMKKLAEQRVIWAESNESRRKGMRETLLNLEKNTMELERSLRQSEQDIRNTEIEYLSH